ncbi:MAG: carboxymuconolactone decarboxylase family protein [Bacteroidota bacterium]
MGQRINHREKGQKAISSLLGLAAYLEKSPMEKQLLNLIDFRVSQINGCAFCLDMHSKDLRAAGETEQRLYVLDAWREAPFYTARERAALAWAEAVTECRVPDEIFEEARSIFSEQELIDLTMAVIAINSFNRINIAFRTPAGTYKPGQFVLKSVEVSS